MKSLKISTTVSDNEAGEVFREFTWALAGMFHRSVSKASKPAVTKRLQRSKAPLRTVKTTREKTSAVRP